MIDIVCVPVLKDNYVWVLHCPRTGDTAVVDPGDADPVLWLCQRRGWTVTDILVTHHHADHVNGIRLLKKTFDCCVSGFGADAARIPDIDEIVDAGSVVQVGDALATVIETPGHTSGHICYWFSGEQALFSGDTLFSLGCGRVFEGTPGQLWSSLMVLRDLPAMTRIFAAHEYTENNARFALTLDPHNRVLRERARTVSALRSAGQATLPSFLGTEQRANPFLRVDDSVLAAALGMQEAAPEEVFAALRHRKDVF